MAVSRVANSDSFRITTPSERRSSLAAAAPPAVRTAVPASSPLRDHPLAEIMAVTLQPLRTAALRSVPCCCAPTARTG